MQKKTNERVSRKRRVGLRDINNGLLLKLGMLYIQPKKKTSTSMKSNSRRTMDSEKTPNGGKK